MKSSCDQADGSVRGFCKPNAGGGGNQEPIVELLEEFFMVWIMVKLFRNDLVIPEIANQPDRARIWRRMCLIILTDVPHWHGRGLYLTWHVTSALCYEALRCKVSTTSSSCVACPAQCALDKRWVWLVGRNLGPPARDKAASSRSLNAERGPDCLSRRNRKEKQFKQHHSPSTLSDMPSTMQYRP